MLRAFIGSAIRPVARFSPPLPSPATSYSCSWKLLARRRLGSSSSMAASPTPAQDPVVQELLQFSTCDISDALVKLNHPNGGFLPGLTMWSPQRHDAATKMAGPAYTVRYAPLDDPAPKHPTHYIDSIPAHAVVFISAPPRVSNAVYGGLMTTRARALGAAGTVVDGRFRDVDEHRALGYAVFARAAGTAPPGPRLKVVGVDVPVTVRGDGDGEADAVRIAPADYLMGDVHGVVVLPRGLAGEALALMRRQVEVDAQMAEAIGGPERMSFVEASKRFRG